MAAAAVLIPAAKTTGVSAVAAAVAVLTPWVGGMTVL